MTSKRPPSVSVSVSADIRAGYDAVAAEYQRRIASELDHKPFDRGWLDRFADSLADGSRLLDLGCGVGHVLAYLTASSSGRLELEGVDLSAGMLAQARNAGLSVPLHRASLDALPFPDDYADACLLSYVLVNLSPEQLPEALIEVARVLKPGGRVAASWHLGAGRQDAEDWWGQGVTVPFYFYSTAVMSQAFAACGLDVLEVSTRGPYAPEVEAQTERGYLLAMRR